MIQTANNLANDKKKNLQNPIVWMKWREWNRPFQINWPKTSESV